MATKALADIYSGLPRRLQVGAFTFRLSIVPASHEKLVDAFGCVDFRSRQIYIPEGLDVELAVNTVVHELTHCINWVYGLGDEQTEEQFTNLHTNGVIDLWMRNPRVLTWITKTLHRAKKDASHD